MSDPRDASREACYADWERNVLDVLGQLDYITSLRSFRALDNLKFNLVPFVQGFVSLAYDCRVMDKYIWTMIASDKAVTSPVIEPLDYALHSSGLPRPTGFAVVSGFLVGTHSLLGARAPIQAQAISSIFVLGPSSAGQ